MAPAVPSLPRRADRFAAALLLFALAALAGAALVPVGPAGSDPAFRSGVAMPVPPGGGVEGGYRRASPFDPQHRPVDEGAMLQTEPGPVVDLGPAPEAPARIAGILLDGSSRKVMFSGGTAWQGVGGTVGSWTVAAIEPRRVTLRRGAETLVLGARDALLAR